MPSNNHSSFNGRTSRPSTAQEPASHFDSDSDYGYDSPRNHLGSKDHGHASQRPSQRERLSSSDSSSESSEEDDSDDMPLAQRIPTALRAQKTLRRQNREQRSKPQAPKAEPKPNQLPGRSQSSNPHPASGVAADDLTRRLLEVQLNAPHPPTEAADTHRGFPIRNEPQLAFPSERRQGERRTRQPAQEESLSPSRQRLQSEHKHANDAPSRARTLTERGSPAHQQNIRRKIGTVSGPHAPHQNVAHAPSIPLPSHRSPVERQAVPEVPSIKSNPQRIYITDSQRSSTVNITATTKAKDILDIVATAGLFPDESGGTHWMLWELDQDFGMERPIREFELVDEVIKSWGTGHMNRLMLRPTQLASALARSAIPTSSPSSSGYVEWEQRPGKWSKRWLDIRENGVWVSKRPDNAKDAVHLCSLSNFDIYQVTRVHKSPKPFVFCLKSTDNITLFENPADHVHIFCCDMTRGMQWVQSIMVARSYVLFHERTILFRDSNEAAAKKSKPLSRSNTKKPPQPRTLVDMDALLPRHFAPGSLLATAKSLPFDAQ